MADTYTAEQVKAMLDAQKEQIAQTPQSGADLLAELGGTTPVAGAAPTTMKWMPKTAEEVYQKAIQINETERVLNDIPPLDLIEALNAMPLKEKVKFFDRSYERLLIKEQSRDGTYSLKAFWLFVFEAEEKVQRVSDWLPPYIKAHCRLYGDLEKFMRTFGVPVSTKKNMEAKFNRYVNKYTNDVMLAADMKNPMSDDDEGQVIQGWNGLTTEEKTKMKGNVKYVYSNENDKLYLLAEYVKEHDKEYWRKFNFLLQ